MVLYENKIVEKTGKEFFDYCYNLEYKTLPADVSMNAKRAIIDTVAAMLAGAGSCYIKTLFDVMPKNPANNKCTIAGSEMKQDAVTASFVNASLAQVFDYNDGFAENSIYGGSIHPGRILVPIGIACAEEINARGKDLITALVAGYETALRIRGIKTEPMADCYGGAMVASKLYGLDSLKMKYALGLSACFSPRNFPKEAGGYDSDFLRHGYKAKASVDAALLSGNGFTGPPLEDDPHLSPRFVKQGLGEEYLINYLYHKPYPVCRVGHGILDTLIKWKTEQPDLDKRLRQVCIDVVERNSYIQNFVVHNNSYYKTAQYSVKYAAAIALKYGKVEKEHFHSDFFSESGIRALMDKITIGIDESLEGKSTKFNAAVRTQIYTTDGDYLDEINVSPKGSPDNPLHDHELFKKLSDCAAGTVKGGAIEAFYTAVMELEKADEVGSIFTLLTADAGREE